MNIQFDHSKGTLAESMDFSTEDIKGLADKCSKIISEHVKKTLETTSEDKGFKPSILAEEGLKVFTEKEKAYIIASWFTDKTLEAVGKASPVSKFLQLMMMMKEAADKEE